MSVRSTVALFLLLSLGACSINYPTPKRYALVFGISTYYPSYPGPPQYNPNLTYPTADADSIAAMLQAKGFDMVVLLKDGAATKTELLARLNALATQVTSNDLVLFYYSGHGTQTADASGTHEWIAPYGTITPPAGTAAYDIDWNAAVRDDELGTMLDLLPTKRKVVILDSCNSGGFISNSLEVDITPPKPPHNPLLPPAVTPDVIASAISNYARFQAEPGGVSPYNALVLSASGADELSWETSALLHGVFTYYLLQAPQKGDLNKDGAVTVLELFALAKAGVDANWNTTSSPSDTFSPRVSGGPVDFVVF